jgi:hypothetical protein
MLSLVKRKGVNPMNQAAGAARKVALTTWEGFWYVLMCIGFAYGYFAKVPVKKALQDFGLTKMTSAEEFWYVLMCVLFFGAAYFAEVPVAKALSELPEVIKQRDNRTFLTGSPQTPGSISP